MKLDYDDMFLASLAEAALRTKGISVGLNTIFLNGSVLVHRLEVKPDEVEEAARYLRQRGMLGTTVE